MYYLEMYLYRFVTDGSDVLIGFLVDCTWFAENDIAVKITTFISTLDWQSQSGNLGKISDT